MAYTRIDFKATELRIGNKVMICFEDKAGWEVATVTQIHDDNTIDTDTTHQGKYYYEPIGLTPEILEQLGFSSHDRSVSFNDSGYDPKTFFYLLEGLDEWSQRVYRYGFLLGQFRDGIYYQANQRRRKGTKLRHLHQLQNLFFILHEVELEIPQIKLSL